MTLRNLKFGQINLKNHGILNFTVSQKRRADNILKKLVASNSISEETRSLLNQLGLGQV